MTRLRKVTQPAQAASRLAVLALASAAVLSACGGTTSTFPAIGTTPRPAGDATAAAKQAIFVALAAAGVPAQESSRPYRPPEGPLLAAAPRSVLQAQLANDADAGYIVIYALASNADAVAAARDHLAYLARGEGGGALLPPGTQVVVRVLGSNVVFFHWLPADATAQMADIAKALGGLGEGVQAPG